MNSNEEKIRAAIAEQAGEWLVANDAEPLDAQQAAALAAWLKTSPVHIEEFLGVSAIARDLRDARTNPEYSLAAILARAQTEEAYSAPSRWPRVIGASRTPPSRRWVLAAAAMSACALLIAGVLSTWSFRPNTEASSPGGIAALHFETRHGELLTQRLPDDSVLHLNTDSSVAVRYSNSERFVTLRSGQASFEVAHEAHRAFRVQAGSADVTDLGTKFDVRLEQGATVVTVVEGRVGVGPATPSPDHLPRVIELKANQQIRVAAAQWPAAPVAVDAERTTAWLRRQIVFDREPLQHVAAEYNRYSSKPIEIATPGLRNLLISGVFATDDTDAFIAFLRSLRGVRVEVTEARIRVSAK